MTPDKHQKDQLMLQAIHDSEFLAHCEEIADETLTTKIT